MKQKEILDDKTFPLHYEELEDPAFKDILADNSYYQRIVDSISSGFVPLCHKVVSLLRRFDEWTRVKE